MINKSFTNKWQRIHTAVRDIYLDMEGLANTNCGVAKEGAVADIKVSRGTVMAALREILKH